MMLLKVFNSRRVNDYVTIDSGGSNATTAITTSPSVDKPPTPPLTSTLPSAIQDQVEIRYKSHEPFNFPGLLLGASTI